MSFVQQQRVIVLATGQYGNVYSKSRRANGGYCYGIRVDGSWDVVKRGNRPRGSVDFYVDEDDLEPAEI